MARPLILIVGETGAGKSSSLENIPNQERWVYFNCDAGKEIPFPNDFREAVITNPLDIPATVESLTAQPEHYDGIIIDTMTFMMEMYRSQYVNSADDGFEGWKNYGEFFRDLIQVKLANFHGAVILLAHTETIFDKDAKAKVTRVPVAGNLAKNGIEAYFTNVICARKVLVDKLKDYANPMLTITEDEKAVGVKHVFQTRTTAENPHDRIRSTKNLWTLQETFIDNDIWTVVQHMIAYYKRGKK